LNTLSEYLLSLNDDSIIWLDQYTNYDVKTILSFIASQREILKNYHGAKVALQFKNDLLLAKALVCLDGVCEQLLLIPPDIPISEAENIFLDSKTELILTDSSESVSEITNFTKEIWQNPDLPIFRKQKNQSYTHTKWILVTSGTTGIPKLVVHTLDTLTRSVVKNIEKGTRFRWGSLYQFSRFAGLQVFFQSIISGSSLIFTNDHQQLLERLNVFIHHNCNAISATPTMWRKILMSDRCEKLKLIQITIGGEIADDKLLLGLKNKYPDARIVHIYASTEAGVGFVVKDGKAGFPVSWLKMPPKGISVQINEDNMLLLKANMQNQQYLNHGYGDLFNKDGFVMTGDIVQKNGDRIYFLGRDNGVINVGGNKVHPEEVEAILLEMPEIMLCQVFGKPNPFTGQLVIAKVVCAKKEIEPEKIKINIIEYCKKRLPSYKVPAMIFLVKTLDVTVTGKVERR
jgi:acyl-coenzyme A synthetase/AMP-(fatty) acid ligase